MAAFPPSCLTPTPGQLHPCQLPCLGVLRFHSCSMPIVLALPEASDLLLCPWDSPVSLPACSRALLIASPMQPPSLGPYLTLNPPWLPTAFGIQFSILALVAFTIFPSPCQPHPPSCQALLPVPCSCLPYNATHFGVTSSGMLTPNLSALSTALVWGLYNICCDLPE